MNILDFYNEELSRKKTNSSKKAFLTKSKNSLESHLKDLKAGLNEPKGNMKFNYLYGEPITHIRISKIVTEIKVIENLQKQLEKGLKGVAKKTTAKLKKSVACSQVLKLMDKDFSYQKALNEVLKSDKRLNKKKLETELNNYI